MRHFYSATLGGVKEFPWERGRLRIYGFVVEAMPEDFPWTPAMWGPNSPTPE